MDNLHWDWENWWRRYCLYFWWTEDTGCAADWGFHCSVPGDDWHPIYDVIISLFSQWDYYYCYWVPSGTVWFSAKKLRPWSQECKGSS